MNALQEAIEVLEDNALSREADLLRQIHRQLHGEDPGVRIEADRTLRGLCQVRSYGDLNITTMNGWQWNGLLEDVLRYSGDVLTSSRGQGVALGTAYLLLQRRLWIVVLAHGYMDTLLVLQMYDGGG